MKKKLTVVLIRVVFSKTLHTCCHGVIINNTPFLVNTINYKIILAKIHYNNLTTAILPAFALNGKYNCMGIGMQCND